MVPKFYEANLSISCVNGDIEGIISSDAQNLYRYLNQRDHEGSSISLTVRYTPDGPFVSIDEPEKVYEELQWLLSNLKDRGALSQ